MPDQNPVEKSDADIEKKMDSKSKVFIKYSCMRINVQKIIGFLTLIPFSLIIISIFKFIMGYKIENVKNIRSQFKEIIKDKRPLIICANHLTFIDSCLIIWALAPNYWYQFNYKYFSWNLPAGDFFGKKFRYRIVAFLSKCIFIHRDASRDHHQEILNICKNLLLNGEVVTIFPEGKRSRSGYFDVEKLTYGVGKIIHSVPDCRVLCVYVRGDKQDTFSNYPAKKSIFYMNLQCVIPPKTTAVGREAYSLFVNQIAQTLKSQEEAYFTLPSHVSEQNELVKDTQSESASAFT